MVAAPSLEGAPATADRVGPTPLRSLAELGFVRERGGRVAFHAPRGEWSADVLADGRVRFSDHKRCGVMRGTCWAVQKRRLLAASFDLRLAMAQGFARKNIARQLRRLDLDLQKIWQSRKPPNTRRALIFALWDECEEALAVDLGALGRRAPSTIDKLRSEAGKDARQRIVSFIRDTIPADDPLAFTASELVAMNERRHSRARFAPYAVR